MKKFNIDGLHHSEVPDPPEDIIKQAMKTWEFDCRKSAIMALKSWCVVASANKWDGRRPQYATHYMIFMSGFVAGFNYNSVHTKEITSGN